MAGKTKKQAQQRIYTRSQQNAQIVRSWRDNLLKESSGIPLLLIVGGKVLMAADVLTNIAHAVESQESPILTVNGYTVESEAPHGR